MRTVIKGAQYFDGDSILIPHFTGEYSIVDCTEYVLLKELKGRYSQDYIKSVKDDFIEHEGKKYYYAEYSPFAVSEDWELLSDISDVSYNEY